MTARDVERLSEAYRQVSEAIEKGADKRAAKILCKELERLLYDHPDFWNSLRGAVERHSEHEGQARDVMQRLRPLIEKEQIICARVGLDDSETTPILRRVIGAIDLTEAAQFEVTDAALENLRDRLSIATKLVCNASKGRFRKIVDSMISWKGAGILAGASVAAVDIAYFLIVNEDGEYVWASVKLGIKAMQRDADGIIDILSDMPE